MRVPIHIDTLVAYMRTAYRAHGAGGDVLLRIGEPNDALRALHRVHRVASSAFVSACNPFGRHASDVENTAAMQSLRAFVDDAGLVCVQGEGQGPDGGWPAEPSMLVLGVGDAQARALCVRFEQNAVVVCAADARPFLLLHPRAVIIGKLTPGG